MILSHSFWMSNLNLIQQGCELSELIQYSVIVKLFLSSFKYAALLCFVSAQVSRLCDMTLEAARSVELFNMISTEKPHANLSTWRCIKYPRDIVMSRYWVCGHSNITAIERIWPRFSETSAGAEVTGDDSAASGANQGWSRNLKHAFLE